MEEDINACEGLRLFYENSYKEDYPDALAVVIPGNVDYDNNPTILEYTSKGYKLIDSNMFGFDEVCGEIVIFSKCSDDKQ